MQCTKWAQSITEYYIASWVLLGDSSDSRPADNHRWVATATKVMQYLHNFASLQSMAPELGLTAGPHLPDNNIIAACCLG